MSEKGLADEIENMANGTEIQTQKKLFGSLSDETLGDIERKAAALPKANRFVGSSGFVFGPAGLDGLVSQNDMSGKFDTTPDANQQNIEQSMQPSAPVVPAPAAPETKANNGNGDLSQDRQQTQQEVEEEQKQGNPFFARVQSGFNGLGAKLASATERANESLGKAGQTFSNGVSSAKDSAGRSFSNLGSTLDNLSNTANVNINTAMNSAKGVIGNLRTKIQSRFQKGSSNDSDTSTDTKQQDAGSPEMTASEPKMQQDNVGQIQNGRTMDFFSTRGVNDYMSDIMRGVSNQSSVEQTIDEDSKTNVSPIVDASERQQDIGVQLNENDSIDVMFDKIEKMGLSDNNYIKQLRELVNEYNDRNISIDQNLSFEIKRRLIKISNNPNERNIGLDNFIEHHKRQLSSIQQSSGKDDTPIVEEKVEQQPLTANNSMVSVNKSLVDVLNNNYLKNVRHKVHTPNIATLKEIVNNYDKAGVKIPDEYRKVIANYLYALINIQAASELKSNRPLDDSYIKVEGGYLPKELADGRGSAAYNASYFVQNSESIINYLNNYINNSYSIEEPVSAAVPQQETDPVTISASKPMVEPASSATNDQMAPDIAELMDQLNDMDSGEPVSYDKPEVSVSYDYSSIINTWNGLINNDINDFSEAYFNSLKIDIESAKLYRDLGEEIPKNIQDIIDIVDTLPNYDAFVAYKANLNNSNLTSQSVSSDETKVTVEEVRQDVINQQQDMFGGLRKLVSEYEELNGPKDYKTYNQAKEYLDMYSTYQETLSSIESQIKEIINGTNNAKVGKIDPFSVYNMPITNYYMSKGIVSHNIPQEKLNDYRKLYNQYVSLVGKFDRLNGLFRNGDFERLLRNKISTLKHPENDISKNDSIATSEQSVSSSGVVMSVADVKPIDINVSQGAYNFTEVPDPVEHISEQPSMESSDVVYTEGPKNKSTNIQRAPEVKGLKDKIVGAVTDIFKKFPSFGIAEQKTNGDGHHTVVSKRKALDPGKLKKGTIKKIITLALATFVGVGAFLVAGQPVSQNVAINTVVNGISAIGTAHSFGEVIRDFKLPFNRAKSDDSMAVADDSIQKPSVTSDEQVSKGDTSRQDSTVKEDTTVHSGDDDIQIGDTVHVNNGSAIYDNVYDASYGTNPLKAYFPSDKDRSIKGVSIELGGNLYYSDNQQEIDNLLRNGGKITSYVVGDENGYEGAYSANNVEEVDLGGMHR